MSALVQNPTARSKYGGNKTIVKQIQRNATTGAFEAFSGSTDCLGAAAASWHQLGTAESTDIPRDSKGAHKIDLVLFEFDILRKNLAINAAPYSTSAATK